MTFTAYGQSKAMRLAICRDWAAKVEYAGNPVVGYNHAAYDAFGTDAPYLRDYQKIGEIYYAVMQVADAANTWNHLGVYQSADLLSWLPVDGINPVISQQPGFADDHYLIHPSVIKIGETWYCYYSAMSPSNISQIFLATSPDFLTWTRYGDHTPIFSHSPQACTPCVILIDGTYYMYYWNREYLGSAQIRYATSPDGLTWTDQDAIPRNTGDWDEGKTIIDPWVTRNPNGQYEMVYTREYWPNQDIGYAVSDDGLNWVKHQGVIVSAGKVPGEWDGLCVGNPVLYHHSGSVYLYMAGMGPSPTYYETGGLYILPPP